ncbi:hypothetical protein DER29_4337 [Micromonospora sp. M71_S20]|uniref:hypothetical protein n=1 Tax=Micromonospora sp. M71_S20 TaxID=592872 RepID=UPI000F233AFD|nr:hypothetical protein [Micromonospora sp. M71_S20]RLK13319.1 hypothetical protein DER29_4337 [Micromonospora sp. M71_S20]
MRARHIWVVAVLAVGLAGCGEEKPSIPDPTTGGAQQVIDAIAPKWPVPNPRDTSDGCKAKDGDSGVGCTSRVTTDAVTVTEYADQAAAKQAASTLAKVGDARPAGRYVLSWAAGEQDLTDDDARADMVRIAEAQSS